MNWLAKLSWKNLKNTLGAFKTLTLMILLVAAFFYGGYRFGNYYHGYQTTSLDNQKSRLEALYLQQEDQIKRINTLVVELEVERLANQKSLQTLKNLEDTNYQLKKELGFYQMVMAPEKQADGVVVDNIEITALESVNHYRFRVVLLQQQKNKSAVNGDVNLAINGSQNGKPAELKLSEISSLTEKELGFNFQYFQVIEGEFLLPEGFIPEQVNVLVKLPKTKWQKFSQLTQSFEWPLSPAKASQVVSVILD